MYISCAPMLTARTAHVEALFVVSIRCYLCHTFISRIVWISWENVCSLVRHLFSGPRAALIAFAFIRWPQHQRTANCSQQTNVKFLNAPCICHFPRVDAHFVRYTMAMAMQLKRNTCISYVMVRAMREIPETDIKIAWMPFDATNLMYRHMDAPPKPWQWQRFGIFRHGRMFVADFFVNELATRSGKCSYPIDRQKRDGGIPFQRT